MITTQTVAAAEALLGVVYTESERGLVAATVGAQIELAQARRMLEFPHSLAPAGRFDPRLPDWRAPPPIPYTPPLIESLPLPADEAEIAFAPIGTLAGWLQAGVLTSVRLTEIYLERISRLGPALACIVTLTPDALTQAEEADRERRTGAPVGPLHGVPFGAKDLLDTARIETAWGAEPYRGRIPEHDCAVVQKLRAAGAILLAKTAVGALAYGDVWYGGKCRNPWNIDEGSSGSSAGSASAMAAGLMAFSIGTETGGSLVAPAMRCGNATLRPTFGRVSRAGIMPLAWSLDKVGPMCRTVDDLALVMHAINGGDPADPGSIDVPFGYEPDRPIAGLRVGYFPDDFGDRETDDLDRQVLELLPRLDLELVPLERPSLPYLSLRSIMFAEAAAAFETLTLNGRDDLLLRQDEDAWPNEFRKARFLSAVDYVQLDRFRRQVMEIMDGCFRQVDAVIGPSMVGPMLTITNYTGHPCVVVRSGFIQSASREPKRGSGTSVAAGPERLVPHGITLWGHLFQEDTILRIGRALERHLAVWNERPPACN